MVNTPIYLRFGGYLVLSTTTPLERFIEQTFPIFCRGRDKQGKMVLDNSVEAMVRVYKIPSTDSLSSEVSCPYGSNTPAIFGSCFAATPDDHSRQNMCNCPYSFDIPYGRR